jgi:methylated-DNA-[protein]-cysteine S-methyltransferase
MHYYSKVETEIGKFWVGWNPKGITLISPATKAPSAFEKMYRRRFGIRLQTQDIPGSYEQALREAAAGRMHDPVPVDLLKLSKFQAKVLKLLQQVPRGEVRTYSWLARKAGRPKAARAAGNAMARNPIPFLIPCHRIVPASGGVGNYGFGPALKRKLLSREGVRMDGKGFSSKA